jgi:flagellar biosynthesis protein FlhA
MPSFIISIAAALIVTRSGSRQDLGMELTEQLSSQPRGLWITSAFLALLAMTPLPTVPLLATSLGLVGLSLAMRRATRATAAQDRQRAESAALAAAPPAAPVEDLIKVDTLELEVGYGLVPLVDTNQGGQLLDRITAVRRQLAADIGLVMPPVRIRDNMHLKPSAYRIKIRGAAVATGRTEPGRLLAMDSGLATGEITGEKTVEPAFGLDAWWIDPNTRSRAETLNYTVVDPTSVLATHLTEVIKTHADELLTRGEVANLLEATKEKAARLVEDTVPAIVKLGELQKIMQNLLRERVPIRDVETILEVLAEWGDKTKDTDILTEYVRNGLRRTICQQYATVDDAGTPKLVCVTLDPALEDQIEAYIDRGTQGTTVSMPARVSAQIAGAIARSLEKVTAGGHHAVVIASPQVRGVVRQVLEAHVPLAAVLGYNEIVPGLEVESLALVGPVGVERNERTPAGSPAA